MNTRLLFAALILLLSTCQKDDDELDYSLIPGEYTGHLLYFTSDQAGAISDNLPDLSKYDGYKTIITKAGSNYTLSFDKSFKYTIPDLSIVIASLFDSNTVTISPVEGQEYSIGHSDTFRGKPTANYIFIERDLRIVECGLRLKSNDPDSVYYLDVSLRRFY